MFYFRQTHVQFPSKYVLVCEDVLENQIRLLERLTKVLPADNSVEVLVVSGAIAAANLISNMKFDLIIADHDMSNGNATDLLNWMNKEAKSIPMITASGIPINNSNMMALGANYKFTKQEVIDGLADQAIKEVLKLK